MTTLTPPRDATGTARRPALLRGLPWTVLRLHRTALIMWTVFVAGTIAVLVWTELVTARSALREQAYCERHTTCRMLDAFAYADRIGYVAVAVSYSFLAVAAFAGGALIGRELESGTARLAWTQSVSPTRWLAARLAVPALFLVAGGTALVLAFRWAWSAHRDLMSDDWAVAEVFVARGPLLVAYALCALAVGTLTALVLRRSLPALGFSVLAMLLVNLVLELYRADFWPTLTRTAEEGDLLTGLSRELIQVDSGGVTASGADRAGDFCVDADAPADMKRCLAENDLVSVYVTYHPPSHYWPLHLVETGIVLALAALAVAASFWLVRRRTA
jgi:hypothetical protein